MEKLLGCRWVFSINYKIDGSIDKNKARRVAKGYTKIYDIEYSETFSPVEKIDAVCVLFSIAANKDWPLNYFDIKNFFLHWEISKDVTWKPLHVPHRISLEWRLQIEESVIWTKTIFENTVRKVAMRNFGYMQSNLDQTLCLKKKNSLITYLIIYVDDMIIIENDKRDIESLW